MDSFDSVIACDAGRFEVYGISRVLAQRLTGNVVLVEAQFWF